MRIAVIGAAGGTGRQLVAQALGRGHTVRAVARDPRAVPAHPRLERVAADAFDGPGLTDALHGVDAITSALGAGSGRAPTEVYSRGVANLLAAMIAHDICRLVVVSAAPAGPRAGQPPLTRFLAMPLLERLFGASYADMRRMEALLRGSAAAWLVLRPPRLLDRAPSGAYRLGEAPLPRGGRITRADLATAMLDAAERDGPARAALYVAN